MMLWNGVRIFGPTLIAAPCLWYFGPRRFGPWLSAQFLLPLFVNSWCLFHIIWLMSNFKNIKKLMWSWQKLQCKLHSLMGTKRGKTLGNALSMILWTIGRYFIQSKRHKIVSKGGSKRFGAKSPINLAHAKVK